MRQNYSAFEISFSSYFDKMVGKYVSLQLAVISGVTAFSCPDTALKVTLCLCFHLSSHPSGAQKSVNSRFFANLRAFSLIIIPLTGMLFERALLKQVKTASSRSLFSLFFNFLRLEFTWPGSYASKIFLLFAILVEMLFFFTPYSSATVFYVLFPSSIFCKAFYFSLIEMFTLFIFHICSGALRCLWKMRILLF